MKYLLTHGKSNTPSAIRNGIIEAKNVFEAQEDLIKILKRSGYTPTIISPHEVEIRKHPRPGSYVARYRLQLDL